MSEAILQPIIKWPGGKAGELGIISTNMPPHIDRYFEPFLGGGAVFLSIPDFIPAYVNDISTDLIQLYRNIAACDTDFYMLLERLACAWKTFQQMVDVHQNVLLDLYAQYQVNSTHADIDMPENVSRFVEQQKSILEGIFPQEVVYEIPLLIRTTEKSVTSKIRRMRKLEHKQGALPPEDTLANIEGALKAALYTHCRHLYNHQTNLSYGQRSAIFYFIRENAYAAMFRFNRKGEFNVPYGGISYNRKDLSIKIDRMRDPNLLQRLSTATLENMDFFDFLSKHPPAEDDFLFLDPPYDTEFSNYDQNAFVQTDQERLANYLIHECRAKFMLVIQATDYILNLYRDNFYINSFDKTYMYTIKSRNNREAEHLMITNYETPWRFVSET